MVRKKGMLFDATMCVGCGECYLACKAQNNLPETNEDFLKDHLSDKTFTVVEQYGDYYARKMCMHCADPACVSVCLVGAFTKTDDGPVLYDYDKCIGCRYCMQACPHRIPRYEWGSTSPKVRKCILCTERLAKGEPTACSEACPTGATQFGYLDELKEEAKQRIADNPDTYYPEVYGLEDGGGTSILVLSPVPFDQLGYASLAKEPLPTYTARAMEKIPSVVTIGGAFLGGMYWLTRRKNEIAKEEKKNK